METGSIKILKLQVMPEPVAGFLKHKLSHKLLGFLNLKRSPGKREEQGRVGDGMAFVLWLKIGHVHDSRPSRNPLGDLNS